MPNTQLTLKTSAKKQSATLLHTTLKDLRITERIVLTDGTDYVKFRGLARDIIADLSQYPMYRLECERTDKNLMGEAKLLIVAGNTDLSGREQKILAGKIAAKAAVHVLTHGGSSIAGFIAEAISAADSHLTAVRPSPRNP